MIGALIGAVAAARTVAAAGHRYWRWVGIQVDGSFLDVSELRVVNGSTRLAVSAATAATAPAGGTTNSGVVNDLMDGNTSTRTYWSATAAEDAGFWIMVDLGSPQTVTGMQMAGFDTSNRYPTSITLQHADDPGGPWTTFGTWTGLTYPGNNTWGPVLEPTPWVTDGLVFMLDPSSYSSGQVWGDAPYDFNLGSTSSADGNDPTHSGGYWSFGGDDYFTAASAATAFIKGMHKAGAQFTIEAWWYRAGDGTNVHPIFDSGTSDQGGADMSRGVIFGDQGGLVNPAGRWGLRIKRETGAGTALNAYLNATPALNAWHHHAVSFTGGPGSFLWLDGAQAAHQGGTLTWDGTMSDPATSDTANPARIGTRGDGAFRVSNGSRLGILRIYNRALSAAELLQNWNADRATYGL